MNGPATLLADSDGGTLALGAANLGLILAVVVFVLVRQFTARQVTTGLYIWVAVLVVRSLLPPGPAENNSAGWSLLAASVAVSVLFGIWRGRCMPLWTDASGVVWRKGNWAMFGLWVLTIAARLAISAVGHARYDEPFNANSIWLGFGVTLAVQQYILLRRAKTAPPRAEQQASLQAD